MTHAELLRAAAKRLAAAKIPEPRLEAELLLARAAGKDPAWLIAHADERADQDTASRFLAWTARRARRTPFAYVVGEKEFFGRSFRVTPAVLVPRPETETLVEAVLQWLPARGAATIVDVGTGSGAIGLTLAAERPRAAAMLYDVSAPALAVARTNAKRLGLGMRVRVRRLDILRGRLPEPKGSSIVVANLPYLPAPAWKRAQPEVRRYEPKLALVSPKDGLAHYQALFNALVRWKRKPPLIALEAEPGQFKALRASVQAAVPGARVTIAKDLHGDDRVLIAEK